MKAKHQRMTLLIIGICSVAIAIGLILTSFKDNIVFFYSPSELKALEILPDREIRVGGLVKEGSYKNNKNFMEFTLTDNKHEIHVTYEGIPPNLFREGQGIVANGYISGNEFTAKTLLAKHDENYMPKEVYDALKESAATSDYNTTNTPVYNANKTPEYNGYGQ